MVLHSWRIGCAVVAIVKNSLGDANVVILFENEYRQ